MYLSKTILVAKVKKTALTTRRRRTAFSKMRSCHVERVIIHATDNSPFFESFEQVKHHGRRLPIFTLVFFGVFIYLYEFLCLDVFENSLNNGLNGFLGMRNDTRQSVSKLVGQSARVEFVEVGSMSMSMAVAAKFPCPTLRSLDLKIKRCSIFIFS